jgi:hypothetical protein
VTIGTMGGAENKMFTPGNYSTVCDRFYVGERRIECTVLMSKDINKKTGYNNKQNNASPLQEFQHGFVIEAPKIKDCGGEAIVLKYHIVSF